MNFFYIARSNRRNRPTSRNSVPATKNVIYNARGDRRHPPTSPMHLPRKMTIMIDPHHIWNVLYNERSNSGYPPTSPKLFAAKNDVPKCSNKFVWSNHDPSVIRPWNRESATRLATEATFWTHHLQFRLKDTTLRPGLSPSAVPLPQKKCLSRNVKLEYHQIGRLPRKNWHFNF